MLKGLSIVGCDACSMRVKDERCRIVVTLPEGKRELGRSRHRCESNEKMDLKLSKLKDCRLGDFDHNRDHFKHYVYIKGGIFLDNISDITGLYIS
jgi:hypothetical protein